MQLPPRNFGPSIRPLVARKGGTSVTVQQSWNFGTLRVIGQHIDEGSWVMLVRGLGNRSKPLVTAPIPYKQPAWQPRCCTLTLRRLLLLLQHQVAGH